MMNKTYWFLLAALLIGSFSCSDSKMTVSTKGNFEKIELPDGSSVFLNKNSSVSYLSNFSDRTIHLKGEAFFEVKKGNKPFVVKTDLGSIKVLGTEFNVKTKSKELQFEVAKGTVQLNTKNHSKQVGKGQKVLFNASKDTIKVGKADFAYKKWLLNVHDELKKLGKEVIKDTEGIRKEFKKVGKEIKKEFK